jgi:hypothetical protein
MIHYSIKCAVIALLCTTCCRAGLRPFDANEAVSRSDAVFLGVLTSSDGGSGVVQIEVRAPIAGFPLEKVSVSLRTIDGRAAAPDLRGAEIGKYRLFFIRRSAGGWAPADANWLSVPGSRGFRPARGKTAVQAVFDNLAAVIRTGDLSDTLEAIALTRHYNRPELLDACAQRLGDPEAAVRLECAAVLVRRNDERALPVLKQVLPRLQDDSWPHNLNLAYAVRDGLSDPRVAPLLMEVYGKRDSSDATRVAVVSALGRMKEPGVAQVLVRALRDSARDVRYAAAVGLADITGQPQWRPSIDEFRFDERKYVAHWEARSQP